MHQFPSRTNAVARADASPAKNASAVTAINKTSNSVTNQSPGVGRVGGLGGVGLLPPLSAVVYAAAGFGVTAGSSPLSGRCGVGFFIANAPWLIAGIF